MNTLQPIVSPDISLPENVIAPNENMRHSDVSESFTSIKTSRSVSHFFSDIAKSIGTWTIDLCKKLITFLKNVFYEAVTLVSQFLYKKQSPLDSISSIRRRYAPQMLQHLRNEERAILSMDYTSITDEYWREKLTKGKEECLRTCRDRIARECAF